MGELEPESQQGLPQELHFTEIKTPETYSPQALALPMSSDRYLKLLLDSEWRQYCSVFDQDEKIAEKVLDNVFSTVSLISLSNYPRLHLLQLFSWIGPSMFCYGIKSTQVLFI